MNRKIKLGLAIAAVVGWRKARSGSNVTSLRKIANAEGVTTWSAWRKGRVG